MTGLPADVPDCELFIKSVDIREEGTRSYTAFVTTRNPEGYSTPEILDALKKLFQPCRETHPIEVSLILLNIPILYMSMYLCLVGLRRLCPLLTGLQ